MVVVVGGGPGPFCLGDSSVSSSSLPRTAWPQK